MILKLSKTRVSDAVGTTSFLKFERVGLTGCCPYVEEANKARIIRNSIRHESVKKEGFSGSVKMRLFIVET